MSFIDYVVIFVLLDFVGFVHIFIIKKNYFSFLNISISKKLFGENKTWRGLIVMSLFSGILGFFYFGFIFSFLLGLFWIIGELPNSFIKRRLGIKPGEHFKGISVLFQYIFDTLDSIIAILIFLNISFEISILSNFLLIFAGFINHSLIDYFCYKIGIKKLKHPNPLIIFVQLFVWLFFQFYLFFKSDYKKIYLNINNSKKNILIANHISKLDPFLICSSISFRDIMKMFPFRYMVTNKYMKRYGKFAKLLGCYPTHIKNKNGDLEHTLNLSKTFLNRGESVFIFPEGGIHKKKFGVGAFYLNKKVKDSQLLIFFIKKDNFKFGNKSKHFVHKVVNEDI